MPECRAMYSLYWIISHHFAKIMLSSVYIFLAVLPTLIWSPDVIITFCISQILINLLSRPGPGQVLKKPGWYALQYDSEKVFSELCFFSIQKASCTVIRVNLMVSTFAFLPLRPPKSCYEASDFTRLSTKLPQVIGIFNNIHVRIQFSKHLKLGLFLTILQYLIPKHTEKYCLFESCFTE